MDWKLELVSIPVTDVDRALAFYTEKAGFNADHDHRVSDEIRFVQPRAPSSSSAARKSATSRSAPGGSFVFFSEPDGNRWAVQQLPARD